MASPKLASDPRRVGIVHVHSDYSHDGHDPLERLREVCIERGIGFVGLTDHAEDFDAGVFLRYQEHCARLSDDTVRLFPGLEFRFAGFPGLHLLALGLREWIAPTTPREFIESTPDIASLTMVAHPLLVRYHIPPEVANGIDMIEVWNAAYNTRYLPDPKAIMLLHGVRDHRPEVMGVAGLDQHDSRNDREVRVILHDALGDCLSSMRAGRFLNVGRTMSFDPTVPWSGRRLLFLRRARFILDGVERTQEWSATRWARRGTGRDRRLDRSQ